MDIIKSMGEIFAAGDSEFDHRGREGVTLKKGVRL
jgi:hypothetical protein